MIDRETVITGLEFTKAMITFNPQTGEDIEPENLNEADKTTYDACIGAIALLKEQEAVEPILIREGKNKRYNDYVCPRCDNEVVYEQNYCSECGITFLWEGR